MLSVRDLTVSVEDRVILRDLDFSVERGETVVLFGPNGSGKTSLLKTLMGFPGYRVETGRILFMGQDVTGLTVDRRARMGMGIAFQRPPTVRGVRLGEMLALFPGREAELSPILSRLNLTGLESRELNLGFSGGEIKRSELAQLLAQRPSFIMFDEPDSGVDLVSIHLVGEVIGELLEKDQPLDRRNRAGIIISHTGHILDYVGAERGYVLLGGSLLCSGDPEVLIDDIRTMGYEECVQCLKK
ncbi:MAG: ABC transporter ATP-binding protein [bacterium]|nr:MAG: ABC transporter ATP-binding protein [bacterium]